MPFEFIQIPANGQGGAKEELNRLLRGGPKIDYKEVLDETQFAVFAKLRDLRKVAAPIGAVSGHPLYQGHM